jgi:hypothetical protein
MHDGVTRRGALQLFAALKTEVPVVSPGTSAPSLPASDAPSPEHRPVRAVFREGGRRG